MKTINITGILLVSVFCISIIAFANPVPDSGQNKCYDDTVEITCPLSGDPFYGQDAQYVVHPQSYTKLDEFGNELPDSATTWAMVRDNVNGLMWEVKTDDGTIHDTDDTYSWQDGQDVFIAQLNSSNFGGHSDWRVPTIRELSFISNSGAGDPAINTAFFPNTVSSNYWSSDIYTLSPDSAWNVNFLTRYVFTNLKTDSLYVRAVRGAQSADIFYDNGNGTVTDLNTSLMWQQSLAGPMNWEEALEYCENLNIEGFEDWRLPDINELQSIVDYNNDFPAIDTTVFPGTASASYWSSTTFLNINSNAWYVYFSVGAVNIGSDKSNSNFYVRAVRGGDFVLVTPVTYDYGIVEIDCTSPQTFTVKNFREQLVDINTISLGGPNLNEFAIQNDNCSGTTLDFLDTCNFEIGFQPQSLGSKNAIVNISFFNPALDALEVPLIGQSTEVCECDLNQDGKCDGIDWLLFYPKWNWTTCNEPGVVCECDLNGDGGCNGLDWLIFYPDWGREDCPICP